MDEREQSRAAQRWTLALASIASFVVALDLLIVTTSLDTIRRDLDVSVGALQWTLTAYSLTFAVFLMAGAALGDRFGRRRVLASGLAVFVIGSAGAALSQGIVTLVAARALQGLGAAAMVPIGLAIVSAAFPPDRRGSAIGILEGVSGLAVVAGPLLGGLLADRFAWEWIFWINVPVGVVAIPLVLTRVEESHGPDAKLDLPGLGLATGAAFGLVWALVRGNEAGWSSLSIVLPLIAGVVLTVGLVAWERRVEEPMLPIALFRSRSFSAGIAAAFLLSASLYGAVFFIAQYLQAGLGHEPLAAGLRLLPWTGTLLLVAPAAGALADRVGVRPVLGIGLTLQGAGMAWLAAIASTKPGYAVLVWPLVVAGVGCSMAIPVSQTAVIAAVDVPGVGKAAGANNAFQELGGAFGVAIAVAVFVSAAGGAGGDGTDGFGPAIGVAAVLAFIGLVAVGVLPRRAETMITVGSGPVADHAR